MGEPLQALRETRRVLRREGRVAFSVWGEPQHNPWMTFSAGLMIERGYMAPFSSDGPGMFSMSTPDKIEPLVNEAGFEDVHIEEMEVSWRFDDADELWIFASELQGPVALAIGKLEEGERRAVRSAIEERAAGFLKDGGYELPGLSLNVVAS